MNGLGPCPGGDCHGIDHAWCAPGKHAHAYGSYAQRKDRQLAGQHGVEKPRHRKSGPVLDFADPLPLIPYLHN